MLPSIRLTDEQSDMEPMESVCKFCTAQAPGRYTCPRCNRRYCSTECYRSEAHAGCSELFFRECFMEGLRDLSASGEERHRIVEMLRRLEDESADVPSSDDDETEDLADRMSGVDLDRQPEEVWRRLTNRERQEFEQLIKDGRVESLVPLWTPWWIADGGGRMVEEVSDGPSAVVLPPLLVDVPDLARLVASPANISDSIPNNVVNILYGYAYVARLYNGDHLDVAAESAQVLCDVSEAIERGVFPDAAAAVAGCMAQLDGGAARDHFVSREYSYAVLDDVRRIIAGKATASDPVLYVVAALSDCHRIFGKARRDTGRGDETTSLRRRYQGAQKKVEFLVSWTRSYGSVLKVALPMLELESCRLTTELADYRSKHSAVEKAVADMKERNKRSSRPLITELSSNQKD